MGNAQNSQSWEEGSEGRVPPLTLGDSGVEQQGHELLTPHTSVSSLFLLNNECILLKKGRDIIFGKVSSEFSARAWGRGW